MAAVSPKLLTIEQVEQVHEASLEILENVGILVRNREARDIFVEHGCHEESEAQIIKFPRSVVEHYRQLIPPTFTFHGRDPSFDREALRRHGREHPVEPDAR